MAAATNDHGRAVGQACVNRTRYGRGCVGRLVVRKSKYRGADGVLTERELLVCSSCGQAHGVAP